ncbi:MAG: hypothetical protein KQ78_01443 [Candidatus Izimaplasma bacterium HR2]|nr:MAG: hypothetical protein KQ78_01443 [Candidatus Izimaplasma bacterium HR2]
MYIYKYVKAISGSFWATSNHQELIDKYSKEGWKFITVIPLYSTTEGRIKELDLVFEREE